MSEEDKIIPFTGVTTVKTDTTILKDNVKWEDLDTGVLIATSKTTEDILVYSNTSDKKDLIYLLNQCIHDILAGRYDAQ